MSQQRTPTKAQVILAPRRDPPIPPTNKTIFLAGSTSNTDTDDWRTILTNSLSHFAGLTILNPYRAGWDSTWREDESFAPFREQVEWELDMQGSADLVIVYFHPATQAVVSLLELGLAAGSAAGAGAGVGGSGVLVVCPDGYWKKGNVSIVCRRFGIEMLGSVDELGDAIVRKLALWRGDSSDFSGAK